MEPVRLEARPGLCDEELLSCLQKWVNERYPGPLARAREMTGKIIQFRHPKARAVWRRGNSGATTQYSGHFGTVTGVAVALNDTALYRLTVKLNQGDVVEAVHPDDVFESKLTQKDFERPPVARPITRFKLAERSLGPEEQWVGRRCRVIERAPVEGRVLYGKEGQVGTVFASGHGASEFAIQLEGEARPIKFMFDQVRFL